MAFELSLTACLKDSCETLKIPETTGAYDVSLNPTGWGAPNPTLAGITEATLSITLPEEEDAVEFDVTSTITGATIVDGEFLLDELTMEDFDSSGAFPDGFYDFEYVVTSGGTDYTFTAKILFTCTVECCIQKMRTNFHKKLCGCEWENYWAYYQGALRELDALRYNAACYNYTQANYHLAALQKICKIVNCEC
jgi:hypothetical protein